MTRALEVNLEYQPCRDKDKRLARAYELLASLQFAQGDWLEDVKIDSAEIRKTKKEETDETSKFICACID